MLVPLVQHVLGIVSLVDDADVVLVIWLEVICFNSSQLVAGADELLLPERGLGLDVQVLLQHRLDLALLLRLSGQ